MSENMKIYDDSFEIEGATYPLNAIKKVTILNEDAKYKGKTKPFTHQVLSGVTMLMPRQEAENLQKQYLDFLRNLLKDQP